MRRRAIVWLAVAVALGASPDAWAYVGPGAGITLVGSFIGLVATVLCALGAILAWPIRRLLRRRRERARPDAAPPPAGGASPP